MNEPFTVVYRGLTTEQRSSILLDPKAVWFGHCHAPYERDEARAALAARPGAVCRDLTDEDMDAVIVAIAELNMGDIGHHAFCDRIVRIAAAPTEAKPAQDAVDADDPLQGAVDWLLQADGEFFCVATVQRTLRIGYNRANRLSEVAKERAAISAKKGGAA